MKRILAISSGGGHWQQVKLLAPAFEGAEVTYACTTQLRDPAVQNLPDCNLRTPFKVVVTAMSAWKLVRRMRPDVIVSTGAAPGVLALIIGKTMGCQTIWIDSIANAETMSLSGRLARRFSDLWMTQWPQVSKSSGATYAGAVL